MKKLSLIDKHCDTAFELYRKGMSLHDSSCHVSLKKAEDFENYTQFFAVWADRSRGDDECFEDFIKVSDNLFSEIAKNSDRIAHVRTYDEMTKAWEEGKCAAFLAVEDARILGGRIERMDTLAHRGVKYLTLLWGGETCIGASHDTEGSLTPFGIEVVKKCFEYGILPDVSHANERVTDQIIELAFSYNKPIIASHSDCYDVFPHSRNLRRQHIDAIKELGGSIGLNLCPWHIKKMLLSGTPKPDFSNMDELVFAKCDIDDVMRHLEGYLELGGEDILGMGADLDGTSLPEGFSGVHSLYLIADEMSRRGYSDLLIEKIFWRNDLEFIKRNF
jgi:membrane dipeptidase